MKKKPLSAMQMSIFPRMEGSNAAGTQLELFLLYSGLKAAHVQLLMSLFPKKIVLQTADYCTLQSARGSVSTPPFERNGMGH
jgi:hypothetical protein